MPAVRAERLCPNAIFVAPDFTRYRAVSKSVREIFKRHTDLIEPLSLDEAYLDVTENKTGLVTATLVARTIREQIRQELSLTASAGVAPNRFLAKLASDWRKPDGLFVIQPDEIETFLLPLPVGRLPGVGKVTGEKLATLGVQTVADLRNHCSNINSAGMVSAFTSSPAVSTKVQSSRTGLRNRSRSRILLRKMFCWQKPSR
jgi:DNA polymerase-4